MQCKDIPDAAFLEAVRLSIEERTVYADRWSVGRILGFLPEKLVLAKARQLIKKRLIDGCTCGCRGDFTIVPVRIAIINL